MSLLTFDASGKLFACFLRQQPQNQGHPRENHYVHKHSMGLARTFSVNSGSEYAPKQSLPMKQSKLVDESLIKKGSESESEKGFSSWLQ